MPSQYNSEGSGGMGESGTLSSQHSRRTSCEEKSVKNYELRRCRSEVVRSRSSTCAECAAAVSPVNGAATLLLGAPEQNALTAIDKIQAILSHFITVLICCAYMCTYTAYVYLYITETACSSTSCVCIFE